MDLKLIFGVMILLAVPFTTESGTYIHTYLHPCGLVKFHGGNFKRSGVIHREFESKIRMINHYANLCEVKIRLTSSFRKDDGRVITGNIVKPSKISNHFIGHAIDMNVIDGSRFCNSRCLGDERKQSKGVKCFIFKIRQDTALRWGGDFSTPDPVHIDDGLNLRNPKKYKRLYASLQTNCKI